MKPLRPFFNRLWNSAVIWSWGFSGLRLSFGILLLPLLMRLSGPDFGFHFLLLSLGALVPLLDLGFLTSINRAICSAMGGASELKAHGMTEPAGPGGSPCFPLLWRLLHATRSLYRYLSLGVFALLGAWGTYVVSLRVHESSDPRITWVAWALTLLSGVFEMYSGWWNVYLRGLNQVLLCARISFLAFGLKFLLACVLLLCGAGLLSVPIAGFVSSFVQRALSRRHSLRFLAGAPELPASREDTRTLVRLLWPNSWRAGCHYFGAYLATSFNAFLCVKHLGAAANGIYGLSLQVASICTAMSLVWVQVKWPFVYQLRAAGDLPAVRRVIQPRYWLVQITFLLMAAAALALGQPILDWLNSLPWMPDGKTLLPARWLFVLLAVTFLELQLTFWTTLYIAENRLPFLWPTFATNVLSALLAAGLLHFTSLGLGALVLAPLLAGMLFNVWYWPFAGARNLQTTLFRFTFRRTN